MLTPRGDLAAAEVAFFTPALLISAFILFRHGFAKKLGWLYLVLLSTLRLIGASTTLYMETQNDHSSGLLETAAITSAIGTAPLLLALMGFLERIHEGMEHKGLSQTVFRPIHLASLAALVIAIIGGIDEAGSDQKTGRALMKAACCLFLAIYLALTAITIWSLVNIRWVLATEKKLLQAGALALPFLLVRIIYSVASGFSGPSSPFYFRNVNVYVQAFMQFLMEAIVVCLYIFAGLMTPKMVKRTYMEGSLEGGKDVESMEMGSVDGAPAQESGRTAPRYEQRQHRRQQPAPGAQQQRWLQPRSIGDHRPGRLIMNATSDRV